MSSDPLKDLQDQIATARKDSTIIPKPVAADKPETGRAGMRAGTEMIGAIMGGLLFGYCFDAMFSTKPFGMVIGLFLGIIGGFYSVYIISRRL